MAEIRNQTGEEIWNAPDRCGNTKLGKYWRDRERKKKVKKKGGGGMGK